MNDHKKQQEQRDRTNTVYYDAQANFGTPPSDAAMSASAGDYRDHKMGIRKASGSSDRGVERGGDRQDDVLYERVHTERRHHHSTSSSSPYPHRPPSRESHQRSHHQPTVIHHQIRSPSSTASPIIMAPMSSSYDYSVGSSASPSAFRAQSELQQDDRKVAGSRWNPRGQQEDFRPGPRASSAANIDALFAPKNPRTQSSSRMAGGYEPTTNVVYSRRAAEPSTPSRQNYQQRDQKDYAVVGAYSNERQQEQPLYGSRGGPSSRGGSVRQHSNDYELDPRLNVTYPQFYVDDWKERHPNLTPTSSGYPRAAPRQSPSFTATGHPGVGRPRFASDAARHLYEEVPMSGGGGPLLNNGYRSPGGYGMKETAILDDYDNVPSEFLDENRHQRKKQDDASNKDGESAIYQPGRYQPC
ncbi:hypothetical protein GCK72_007127 [Caenorhabditis remanei]|uniref:Uncharacterized protein n=1 Tax=Caenorhabditis remanei TaxID=31234 RepID=A0A6A5HH60_CAERE|nr:hypothetical protein GCK72_007127 [Caenorhabditis remanei]KAF1767168.1 hypothetical protein GCK72_007127 [Caenorhabditis remanei]